MSLEKLKAKTKATQVEALLVESISITPSVTRHDSAGNLPYTYVEIMMIGRPYYQGNTVTSAQMRFLPQSWGGMSGPAYMQDRKMIIADHPIETFDYFRQVLRDGGSVMCVFTHSDLVAKSDCHLHVMASALPDRQAQLQ